MGKQFGVFLKEEDYDLVLGAIFSVQGAVFVDERPATCSVQQVDFYDWLSIERPLGYMRILIAHKDLLDQVLVFPSGLNGQPITDSTESPVIQFDLCIQRGGAIEAGRFYRQDFLYDPLGNKVLKSAIFIKMSDQIYKKVKRALKSLTDKYYYAGPEAIRCRGEGVKFKAAFGGSEII